MASSASLTTPFLLRADPSGCSCPIVPPSSVIASAALAFVAWQDSGQEASLRGPRVPLLRFGVRALGNALLLEGFLRLLLVAGLRRNDPPGSLEAALVLLHLLLALDFLLLPFLALAFRF